MGDHAETPPVSGPGLIGQLAEIAIGAYTDIVSLIAPAQAAPGEVVTVEARIKNLHTIPIFIAVTGRYNGIDFAFSPEYATVDAGATYLFTFPLSMPSNEIRLQVWAFYWTGTEWYQDDYDYVDIALKVPVAGTISRMELEHDEALASIPAYDILQNDKGLVYIRGRNDTSVTQRMGISWIVRDPDGITVEEYSTWEVWWTMPGGDHEFIGDRFTLSKVGNYRVEVSLFMNPDDPVTVDSYNGILCTVAAPPEVYKGTISRKELEYDASRSAIPVY